MEDQEYDSNSTVLLADFVHKPEKFVSKRRKLKILEDCVCVMYADKYEGGNTAPNGASYSEKTDGPSDTQKNKRQQTSTVTENVTKQIPEELNSDNEGNLIKRAAKFDYDDNNISTHVVFADSYDETQTEGNSPANENVKKARIHNVHDDINNLTKYKNMHGKLKKLNPLAFNAQQTINIFKSNVFMKNSDNSLQLDKIKKDTHDKVLKLPVIGTRRATRREMKRHYMLGKRQQVQDEQELCKMRNDEATNESKYEQMKIISPGQQELKIFLDQIKTLLNDENVITRILQTCYKNYKCPLSERASTYSSSLLNIVTKAAAQNKIKNTVEDNFQPTCDDNSNVGEVNNNVPTTDSNSALMARPPNVADTEMPLRKKRYLQKIPVFKDKDLGVKKPSYINVADLPKNEPVITKKRVNNGRTNESKRKKISLEQNDNDDQNLTNLNTFPTTENIRRKKINHNNKLISHNNNEISKTSNSLKYKYHCSSCKEEFSTYLAAMRHKKQRHPKARKNLFKKIIIVDNSLPEHKTKELTSCFYSDLIKDPYVCGLCLETFSSYYAARKHRIEKHSPMSRKHFIIKGPNDVGTNNERRSNKEEIELLPSSLCEDLIEAIPIMTEQKSNQKNPKKIPKQHKIIEKANSKSACKNKVTSEDDSLKISECTIINRKERSMALFGDDNGDDKDVDDEFDTASQINDGKIQNHEKYVSRHLKIFQTKAKNEEEDTIVADIFICHCGLCFVSWDNLKCHFVFCEKNRNRNRMIQMSCPDCTVMRSFLPTELAIHRSLHHGTAKYKFKVQRISIQEETDINNSSEAVIGFPDDKNDNGSITRKSIFLDDLFKALQEALINRAQTDPQPQSGKRNDETLAVNISQETIHNYKSLIIIDDSDSDPDIEIVEWSNLSSNN